MIPAPNSIQLSVEIAWGYFQNGLPDQAVTTILDSLEDNPDSKELNEALTELTNATSPPPLPMQLAPAAIALPKMANANPVPEIVHPQLKKEAATAPAPVVLPEKPQPVRKSLEDRIIGIFKMPAEQLKPAAVPEKQVIEKPVSEKPVAEKKEQPSSSPEQPDIEPQNDAVSIPSDDEKSVVILPKVAKAEDKKAPKRKRHPDQDVIAGLTFEMPERRGCVKRMYERKTQKAAAKAIIDLTQEVTPKAEQKKDEEKK